MAADNLDTRNILFVYGTLLLPTGDAPVDMALSASARSMGRGYVHGLLFDLGEYPGATGLPPGDAETPRKVWGALLKLSDPDAVFSALDAYEGFDMRSPSTSEFIRTTTEVMLPESGNIFMSQIYFYNFPITGRKIISSGDYLAFKQAEETRP